jgi:hypothetical protein
MTTIYNDIGIHESEKERISRIKRLLKTFASPEQV